MTIPQRTTYYMEAVRFTRPPGKDETRYPDVVATSEKRHDEEGWFEAQVQVYWHGEGSWGRSRTFDETMYLSQALAMAAGAVAEMNTKHGVKQDLRIDFGEVNDGEDTP